MTEFSHIGKFCCMHKRYEVFNELCLCCFHLSFALGFLPHHSLLCRFVQADDVHTAVGWICQYHDDLVWRPQSLQRKAHHCKKSAWNMKAPADIPNTLKAHWVQNRWMAWSLLIAADVTMKSPPPLPSNALTLYPPKTLFCFDALSIFPELERRQLRVNDELETNMKPSKHQQQIKPAVYPQNHPQSNYKQMDGQTTFEHWIPKSDVFQWGLTKPITLKRSIIYIWNQKVNLWLMTWSCCACSKVAYWFAL